MNRPLARTLCLAALLLSAAAAIRSQALPLRASTTLTAPMIQVVPATAGANVRGLGPGQGSLDLGHMQWAQTSPAFGLTQKKDLDSFSISTSVGLRLDCPVSATGRNGTVTAALQQPDSRYTVFLDGTKMTSSPSILNASMMCGSTTQHSFQVQIPITAQAGPINPNLIFQVTLR